MSARRDWPAGLDLDAAAWDRTARTVDAGPKRPSWHEWDDDLAWPAVADELLLACPEQPTIVDEAVELSQRLTAAVEGSDARGGVAAFLAEADSRSDLLDRRAVVIIQAHLSGMTLQPRLPLPPDDQHPASRPPRLLRPLETGMLRIVAIDDRRAVLLRLLAAGATEVETARVRADHIQVTDDQQVLASLPGGRGIAPRTVALAPPIATETSRLIEASTDGWLLPAGKDPDPGARHKVINKILRRLLVSTGLGSDPTVTAASIRNSGLRAAHDQFGFEAAAAIAGTTRLEQLRRNLHLDVPDPASHPQADGHHNR